MIKTKKIWLLLFSKISIRHVQTRGGSNKWWNAFMLLALVMIACTSADKTNLPAAPETSKAVAPTVSGEATTDGWYMKATINGTSWVANTTVPPDAAGRIIGYHKKEYIGLPYSKNRLKPGTKTVFSEDEVADLSTSDDVGTWGGKQGEMIITKNDGKFAEGSFHFIATSSRSDKKMEVTNGTFKIQLQP